MSVLSTDFLPLIGEQVTVALAKKTRLQAISFRLETSGITIMMGPNGSGKTLLLKTIAGLLVPSKGRLYWQRAIHPPLITWVPPRAVLLNRSVMDNLLLPLQHQKRFKSTDDIQKLSREALSWAGVGHLENANALSLSTGEQQLLTLARAWSLSPKVLILDEPSANLDPTRQGQIDPLIKALSQQCKVIMSTHSIRQARELAADIILLNHGKLITHVNANEFFQSQAFNTFSNHA